MLQFSYEDKKSLIFTLLILLGSFSFYQFSYGQDNILNFTVNGKSSTVRVERNDILTLKWSFNGSGSCSFFGNYSKDTQGRFTEHDDYYRNLPTSGTVYIYADHPNIPGATMLQYGISCEGLNSEYIYVYVEDKSISDFEITKPKQNSFFKPNKNVSVKWKSDKKIFPKINIYLDHHDYSDTNTNYRLIKADVKNKGSFSWKIPKNHKEGTYSIVIKDTSNLNGAELGRTELFTIKDSSKNKEPTYSASSIDFDFVKITDSVYPEKSKIPLTDVKITAKDGDAILSSITFTDDTTNNDSKSKVGNLYLYEGKKLIAQIDRRFLLKNAYYDGAVQYDFDFKKPLIVSKSKSTTLTLKGDIKQNTGSIRFMFSGVGYPSDFRPKIEGIGKVSTQLNW